MRREAEGKRAVGKVLRKQEGRKGCEGKEGDVWARCRGRGRKGRGLKTKVIWRLEGRYGQVKGAE